MLTIKEKRIELGLLQKEIASFLDVPRRVYGDWETGLHEPNINNLIKLSLFFKTTVDDIIGIEKKGEL